MNNISVIIPTYNREKTIEYCLRSVLGQTLQPIEIIIIDDCSTDKTISIIESIKCPLVKIISLNKRSGAQVARNTGIRNAKGTWIALQDSDDEWVPTKLEIQINYALQNHFSVVYSDGLIIEGKETRRYNVGDFSVESYKKLLMNPGPMFQGMLIKKECFDIYGYLDELVPAYQEWDTSIMLSKNYNFGFINEILYYYYLHDGETISKEYGRNIKGFDYIINKYANEIRNVAGITAYLKHLKSLSDQYLILNDISGWSKFQIRMLVEMDGKSNLNKIKILTIRLTPRIYLMIRLIYIKIISLYKNNVFMNYYYSIKQSKKILSINK